MKLIKLTPVVALLLAMSMNVAHAVGKDEREDIGGVICAQAQDKIDQLVASGAYQKAQDLRSEAIRLQSLDSTAAQ